MTRTTIQLDVPTPVTPTSGAIDVIKVYPAGETSGPESVIVDLLRNRKVAPHEGGGYIPVRQVAFALTRDEAFNVIRALQRAMGIDPDRLVRAMRALEVEDDGVVSKDPFGDFDELYAAVAEVTGLGTAAERAGTDWASLKGER